jgi:hypothetical protein
MRVIERARYQLQNLDYLKWLVGYVWNQGVQLFKQGGGMMMMIGDEQEARNWMNLAMGIFRRCSEEAERRLAHY